MECCPRSGDGYDSSSIRCHLMHQVGTEHVCECSMFINYEILFSNCQTNAEIEGVHLRPVDPGSSVGTSLPSDTLGPEFDPGKRDFSH